VVEDEGLTQHQCTSQGHGDHFMGVAGEALGMPQPQMLLVCQVEGKRGETHGVLLLGVHARPGGLPLVQEQQDGLTVSVEEGRIPYLQLKNHLECRCLLLENQQICGLEFGAVNTSSLYQTCYFSRSFLS
jgi:hypothetical protein